MHPANVTRGPNEPPVDFSLKGVDTLQHLRFTNPSLTSRHPSVQDPRFWNLFQADFYNSVILSKKHPVVRHRFIDWEGCENMGDADMTSALRNLERKGLKNIMTMEYPWNDEVVAQFYATLWVKKVDEEADGYDYPVMYFFIQGNWHKVSYRRFAHILGFSDADIEGSNMRVHDIKLPMWEETEFIHVSMDREFWTTANMHRYYRYLNSLSMTVLPKGRNQMNVLGESHVFLLLLAPNSLARINVFDMIWEEIIRASWSPLKGCLHAPFIMNMIEVVTQTHFEKPVKHSRYVPYWVDSTNPAARTKRSPSGSGGPACSDEPPSQPPHHPSSSRAAAASRLMDRNRRGSGPSQGRGRDRGLFIRLAKGLLGVFAMCRTRAVEESVRCRRTD
jgi:hypothetical protein